MGILSLSLSLTLLLSIYLSMNNIGPLPFFPSSPFLSSFLLVRYVLSFVALVWAGLFCDVSEEIEGGRWHCA